MKDGFLKIACVTPPLRVADCTYNADQIIAKAKEAAQAGAKLAAFPELCLTGYTCGDLFLQDTLLKGADEERVYSCIPLMGIGMAVAPYDGTRSTVAFSLGILNRIRLAEQLDLNIEAKGTIVGDKLDGEVTGSRGEGSAALTVGLAYTF